MCEKALWEVKQRARKDVRPLQQAGRNVNSYNKAVNDLVVTVNTAMNEPKGSKLAPR